MMVVAGKTNGRTISPAAWQFRNVSTSISFACSCASSPWRYSLMCPDPHENSGALQVNAE